MSSYVFGLSAALLGNIVIGTGQCLQKYGLNRLQREWENTRALHLEGGGSDSGSGGGASNSTGASSSMYATAVDIRARGGSVSHGSGSPGLISGSAPAAKRADGPRPRYTSAAWVVGLLLNYSGELFGNSVALSYLSASAVAPLGIVSVVVSVLLASRFLGERITAQQRHGFAIISLGVGCVLLVAPRRSAAADAVQFVEVVSQSGVLRVFCGLYLLQAVLITVIRRGHRSLFMYVLVAAIFGSMNVMASKMLTMFVRLRLAFSGIPNPADVAFYGASGAATARPLVLGLTLPQVLAATCMALSIVGQESFRQQALGSYSAMEFQPVFFATYNVVATLAGLVLFRELDGWAHAALFFSVFAAGIALVVYGSRFLQKAKAVELPSHIRLHTGHMRTPGHHTKSQ
ncbi:hypothetical protein LPJ53_004113 [Coemansia erecta]|uniref:DUF803-domain-containing protein n=1 Tax=Coemansia erecta TaxID=147472 RepID=A0A9W8CPJ3_9FUNG|nr:hypothetical protein LPJ53_004113 [Coemansia erecta]